VHDIDSWHEAIGHDGRPDGRTDRHPVDQVQPLGKRDVSNQDVLLYVELLQCFYQVNEMLTRAVKRLREVNVTDMHVQSGRHVLDAAVDSSSLAWALAIFLDGAACTNRSGESQTGTYRLPGFSTDILFVDGQVVADVKPGLFVFGPDVRAQDGRGGLIQAVQCDINIARAFFVLVSDG